MSSDRVLRTPPERTKELVIVRRRMGSGRHETHGGIWKIAYADFMTAMMAFFLVMWLLSATDKQTIAAVANYFNPVKLSDRVTSPKGLRDMDSGARGKENAPRESLSPHENGNGDPRSEGSFQPSHPEEMLFRNPYGILEQLAETVEARPNSKSTRVNRGEAL